MKKIAIVLLAVLMMACGIGLIACDKGKTVLATYLFEKDGETVTEEFELPRTIGDLDATWTSSSDYITITDRSAEDKDFLAKPTRPETGKEAVTLTVKVDKSTKDFTVYVEALDVYSFSGAYKFPKDKALITEDFNLDSKTTLEGKEATITWSVKDEYKSYIKVENGKCVVTPSSLDPEVRITAEFSYKGETTKKDYRMTVSIEKTALEAIDYWYNNTGVSVDIKGYVVSVGTAYSSSYNNINLYVVDVEGRCGYYVYRVNLKNKDDGAKIKRGSYVEITGTTNTNYSGLIETNAGGQLVIDESKNITVEQLDAMCYALDNDLVGKVPEAIYHTSQYVSLTNWKVKKICAEVKAEDGVDNKDLFVLEKNGVEVTVKTSKYLEDIYKNKDDQVFVDIVGLQKTLAENDVVTIKGILGNYKGYTIMPLKASDVVKVGTTADSTDTINAMPGVKVGKFLTDTTNGFNTVVKNNNLNLIITKDATITLPASTADVTVVYSLLGTSNAIAINGNTLTISNISAHERVHLQADLTCGEYSTTVFQYIEVWNKTDAEMIDDEILELYMDEDVELLAPSVTALQNIGSIYGANVEITWAVKEPATHAYATIKTASGKQSLVINHMTLADQKVTIVATVKVKDSTATPKTKEFTFAIPNIVVKVDEPAEKTAYSLVIDQKGRGETLFVKDSMSGFYIATSTSASEAGEFYIEKVEGGIRIYYKDKDNNNVYLSAEPAVNTQYGSFTVNIVLSKDTKSVWVLDEAGYYKTTVDKYTVKDGKLDQKTGTQTMFVGTNGTYSTVSLSDVDAKNITADKIGSDYYPIYFADVAKIADVAADTAATLAIGDLKVDKVTEAGTIDLATAASYYSNPTTTWAIKGTTTVATVSNNKLTVAALPAEETTITLTATVKVGSVTKTKDFTVTIAAAPKATVTKVAPADLQEGTAYKLVMDHTGNKETYFAKSQFSGYYLATTTEVNESSDIYVETVEGGVKLYFLDGETRVYLGVTIDGNFININIGGKKGAGSSGTGSAAPAEGTTTVDVWTITADYLSIKVSDDLTVYLGTANDKTYKTFSFSKNTAIFAAYLATVD